jgi:tRNA/rRNA methyltransferase
MKNFGLSRLVLVNPPAWDPERARWMAPGCDDVLNGAAVVGTLDEALVGVHRAVATTARHRRWIPRVLEPAELATSILDDPDDRTTAVLFGREDNGLDAAAVGRCEATIRIPTPEHASLNLGQAVLVIAHTLFEAARARGLVDDAGRPVGGHRRQRSTASLQREDPLADVAAIEGAVGDLVRLLNAARYPGPDDKVGPSARAALMRAAPTAKEISALRGMINKVAGAVRDPG